MGYVDFSFSVFCLDHSGGNFQRVDRHPRVSLRLLDQKCPSVGRDLDFWLAETVLGSPNRPIDDRSDFFGREGMEDGQLAAGEERRNHLEGGILRRGADEDKGPPFHVRQEGVLLSFIEMMDFVYEENRRLAEPLEAFGLVDYFI
jgi:hypothetical protein